MRGNPSASHHVGDQAHMNTMTQPTSTGPGTPHSAAMIVWRRYGIKLGGTVWLVLSAPLLACASSSIVLATVALHTYGGAIAGLHVEYYLLRGERPCES